MEVSNVSEKYIHSFPLYILILHSLARLSSLKESFLNQFSPRPPSCILLSHVGLLEMMKWHFPKTKVGT